MTKTITLREANQVFARCIREVEAGEEFVITRKGEPVARLVPIPGRRVLTPRATGRPRSRASAHGKGLADRRRPARSRRVA